MKISSTRQFERVFRSMGTGWMWTNVRQACYLAWGEKTESYQECSPQVIATSSTVTLVLTSSGGQRRSWHCQGDEGILSFLVRCC